MDEQPSPRTVPACRLNTGARTLPQPYFISGAWVVSQETNFPAYRQAYQPADGTELTSTQLLLYSISFSIQDLNMCEILLSNYSIIAKECIRLKPNGKGKGFGLTWVLRQLSNLRPYLQQQTENLQHGSDSQHCYFHPWYCSVDEWKVVLMVGLWILSFSFNSITMERCWVLWMTQGLGGGRLPTPSARLPPPYIIPRSEGYRIILWSCMKDCFFLESVCFRRKDPILSSKVGASGQ